MPNAVARARRFGWGGRCCWLLLGAIFFFQFWHFAPSDEVSEPRADRGEKNLLLAGRVAAMTAAHSQDVLLLFQVADPYLARERITERAMEIDRLLDDLEEGLAETHDGQLLAEVRSRQWMFMNSVRKALDLFAAGLRADAIAQLVSEAVPALGVLQASVSVLSQSQAVVAARSARGSLQPWQDLREMLRTLGLTFVAVVIILFLVIIRLVRRVRDEPKTACVTAEKIVREHREEIGANCEQGEVSRDRTPELREFGHPAPGRTAAENVTREDQFRFRGLVEALPDVVWEVDSAWRYTYVSPHVEQILGYKAEELLGRSFFELMPVDEALRMTEIICALGAIRAPIEAKESQYVDRQGKRVVLERSGQPFFDDQGRLLGYRGLDRDITQRKEIEEAHLAEAGRLCDTLLREVHHRIKNNLQTVTTVLRREADAHPEIKGVIDSALAQVNAVAAVHGLYGRVTKHRVLLDELLSTLVHAARKLSRVPIAFELPASEGRKLLVRENETVTLSLILNELLTNAVKYSSKGSKTAPRVVLDQGSAQGVVQIMNVGELPRDFDFSAGRGLGSGLGLVRALMPRSGMTIAFRQSESWVEVEVRIASPMLDTSPRYLRYA